MNAVHHSHERTIAAFFLSLSFCLTGEAPLLAASDVEGATARVPSVSEGRADWNPSEANADRRLLTQASQSPECLPQSAPPSPVVDLPQDYIDSYAAALTRPSPQTYYRFAKTLVDYGENDNALRWLDRTEQCFPETLAVSQMYRAVALAQAERLPEATIALEAAEPLANSAMYAETKGYLLTLEGEWDAAAELLKLGPSAASINNFLIVQYCSLPPELDRKTDVPNAPCPYGTVLAETVEPSDEGRENLDELIAKFQRSGAQSLYVLNTIGFLALQMEDYDMAYDFYTRLQTEVEGQEFTSREVDALKQSATAYANNYEQNAAFLEEREQDLDVLRSERQNLMTVVAIAGTAQLVDDIASSRSTSSIIGRGIGVFIGAFGLSREAKQLKRERRALLDSVRRNFLQDIRPVAAPPELDPNRLLLEIGQ